MRVFFGCKNFVCFSQSSSSIFAIYLLIIMLALCFVQHNCPENVGHVTIVFSQVGELLPKRPAIKTDASYEQMLVK